MFGLQSLVQGLADFSDQEVEGNVADVAAVLQRVRHHDKVGHPPPVQTIVGACGYVQRGQRFGQQGIQVNGGLLDWRGFRRIGAGFVLLSVRNSGLGVGGQWSFNWCSNGLR